ncbi:MAG: hypothetical protein ACRD2J_00400, partial [Thermoanaerobaculia bacterium]
SRAELWRIEDRLGENVMAGTASQSFNYERDILCLDHARELSRRVRSNRRRCGVMSGKPGIQMTVV